MFSARETGDSLDVSTLSPAIAGSQAKFDLHLGLAPQALFFSPASQAMTFFESDSLQKFSGTGAYGVMP